MSKNEPTDQGHRRRLQAHLEQLRTELASTRQLDSETRALLEETAGDIEQALHENALRPSTFKQRLDAAALDFEAEHPALARVLREVTDTLAKLGV